MPGARARLAGAPAWVAWLGGLAAVTAAMVQGRAVLHAAHVVLAYLLLVLGASASGGRALGLTLAVLAFGCFNFFFVPPYHTLAVAEPLDWLVLGAFLTTSAVAAHLLSRAQREAAEARHRAAEVDRLAALGAEALNAGRAEEALEAVADVIRGSVGVARCEVYLRGEAPDAVVLAAGSGALPPSPRSRAEERSEERAEERAEEGLADRDARAPGLPDAGRLVAWVAENGRPAAARADGALRFGDVGAPGESRWAPPASGSPPAAFDASGARTLLLPLRVRDRTVGVLALLHGTEIVLDEARRRLLEALAYYAALGAERVRLAGAAEHAEALREADRLKDALLASVSHDLRTPLTTIKALAHAIGTEGDERAVIIEEEADRLNRFVADLLDLSRLNAGELRLAPKVAAAEDLVGAALQRVSGLLAGREVRASLDPGEPLLLGRFDFVHSLRVLANLLENAHKYAPPGTPVDLSARREGDRLLFEVADRGPGIPSTEAEQVFSPFYRAQGARPDIGGAGLGLSISRRLAEAQGGSLAYEPRPGGGSVFRFALPAADFPDGGIPL